jgi:hypothetical protein
MAECLLFGWRCWASNTEVCCAGRVAEKPQRVRLSVAKVRGGKRRVGACIGYCRVVHMGLVCYGNNNSVAVGKLWGIEMA